MYVIVASPALPAMQYWCTCPADTLHWYSLQITLEYLDEDELKTYRINGQNRRSLWPRSGEIGHIVPPTILQ